MTDARQTLRSLAALLCRTQSEALRIIAAGPPDLDDLAEEIAGAMAPLRVALDRRIAEGAVAEADNHDRNRDLQRRILALAKSDLEAERIRRAVEAAGIDARLQAHMRANLADMCRRIAARGAKQQHVRG